MLASFRSRLPQIGAYLAAGQRCVREDRTSGLADVECLCFGILESCRGSLAINRRSALAELHMIRMLLNRLLEKRECPVHIHAATTCNQSNLVPGFQIEHVIVQRIALLVIDG